jgi:hypothetical protein
MTNPALMGVIRSKLKYGIIKWTCIKKVSPFLNFQSPSSNDVSDELFDDNRRRISISGVQEKFSVIQEKNQLRLIYEE